MADLNLRNDESQHLRYDRQVRPGVCAQRYTKGTTLYRAPEPNTQTEVAGQTICDGQVYQAVPKEKLTDARGAVRKIPLRMVGAKNNRGELLLCFVGEEDRPLGGYPLSLFARAVPEQ